EQRRGNHRHDGDEGLEHHAAVADEAYIRLARDELRRRAARHQRVEAGHRAAGDGYEDEREYLAAEDRPMAVDERGQCRHPDLRVQHHDGDRKERHGAQLEKRGEVVTRREEQPYRQDGRDPTVADHEARKRQARPVEQAPQQRLAVDPPAAQHREQHEGDADQRGLENPSRPQAPQVQSDEDGDRYGGEDGCRGPGTVLHRVDDNEAEHRDQEDHDEERADERRESPEGTELIPRHLTQAAAVASGGKQQDGHVLYATAQHG